MIFDSRWRSWDFKECWNNGHYYFFPGRNPLDYCPLNPGTIKFEKWMQGWAFAEKEYNERQKKERKFELGKEHTTKWQMIERMVWSIVLRRNRNNHQSILEILEKWYQEQSDLKEMNQQ